MVSKIFCTSCGLEVKWYESICPRCKHDRLRKIAMPTITPLSKDDINSSNNARIGMANGIVKSKQKCFLCDGEHYMVYPVLREKHYDNYKRLTTLPHCPKKVWQNSKIKIALSDLLEKCKVEDSSGEE